MRVRAGFNSLLIDFCESGDKHGSLKDREFFRVADQLSLESEEKFSSWSH